MTHNLWIKDGQAVELPVVVYVNGFAYTNLAADPDARIICGYTEPAPPYPSEYDPATQEAVWDDGAWVLYDRAPSYNPIQISKIDFIRRFTLEEQMKLEILEDAAKAADLTDPQNQQEFGMVRIVLRRFNLLNEFVEINHPETIAYVRDVLVSKNVVTLARADEILTP